MPGTKPSDCCREPTMSDIREYLDAQDEDFLLLEPASFDAAIVGLVDRPEGGRAVCYDVEKVLEVLVNHSTQA